MFRCSLFALVGALPGLLIAAWEFRLGMAWAFVGACFSALCALGRPDAGRTATLLIAMIIAKNVPGMDHLLDPDFDSLSQDEKAKNDRVLEWFRASDIRDRRNWVILAALFLSLIVSVMFAVHDWHALAAARNPIVIRPTPKNGFGVQVFLMTLGMACWFSGIAGLLFSPAYRRPVVASLSIPLVAYIALLIAGSNMATVLLFVLGAMACGVGTIAGWLAGMGHHSGAATDREESGIQDLRRLYEE